MLFPRLEERGELHAPALEPIAFQDFATGREGSLVVHGVGHPPLGRYVQGDPLGIPEVLTVNRE